MGFQVLTTSGGLKLSPDANVALTDAANTFTLAGNNFDEILAVDKGLQFPATQVADAGANVLDDYEEGSWTPVIGGATSETGQAYSIQVGRYVKVGLLVHVQFFVTLSTKGTITGIITLKGLPFTIENTSLGNLASAIEWITTVTPLFFAEMQGAPNTSTAAIQGVSSVLGAIGMTSLQTADIGNTTGFMGIFSYRASA